VRLIIDITNIAKAEGLTLTNISISGPDTTGGKAVAGALGPQESPYGTVAFSFGIATTYEKFKQFLSDLEHSLRVMDITGITFGESSSVTGVTVYSVQGQTYWLR
jgi:hypothetical protein